MTEWTRKNTNHEKKTPPKELQFQRANEWLFGDLSTVSCYNYSFTQNISLAYLYTYIFFIDNKHSLFTLALKKDLLWVLFDHAFYPSFGASIFIYLSGSVAASHIHCLQFSLFTFGLNIDVDVLLRHTVVYFDALILIFLMRINSHNTAAKQIILVRCLISVRCLWFK